MDVRFVFFARNLIICLTVFFFYCKGILKFSVVCLFGESYLNYFASKQHNFTILDLHVTRLFFTEYFKKKLYL